MEPEDRARLVHDQQRFEQLVEDAFRSVHGIWPFVSSIGVFSHVLSCACVCSRSRACAPMRVRVAPFACESVHSYACVCRRVRECAVVCFVFSETTHTPSPMGKMFHHPLDAKEQEIFKEMQVNWKNLYRMNLYQKKRKTGRCASGRWPPV